MAWSASELITSITLYVGAQLEEGGLDRRAWEEGRKGMEYVETALPELGDAPSGSSIIALMVIQLLRILGVVAIAAGLIFLIVRGVRRYSAGSMKGKNIPAEEQEEMPTAIAPIDVLTKAFEDARSRRDFREALRLLYQICIKQLDMAGALVAHPDKTNWEYVAELKEPSKSQQFARLTMLFEHSWYGEFAFTSAAYEQTEPRFMAFIKSQEN